MAQRVITPQEVELAMLLGRSQRESGSDYLWAEALPDGRWIYLLPLFQGYRLGVSRDRADQTFQDIYDFPMSEAAWRAVVGWDGEGD